MRKYGTFNGVVPAQTVTRIFGETNGEEYFEVNLCGAGSGKAQAMGTMGVSVANASTVKPLSAGIVFGVLSD
jgi:hypothetical protein